MKKKIVLSLILFVSCLSFLGAMNNVQKIYPVDSDVYSTMEKLYLMEGHSLPSTAGPWSQAELVDMLSFVHPTSTATQKVYDSLADELSTEPKIMMGSDVGMTFNINTIFEMYVHTNEVFKDEEYWVHGFNDRAKFLDIEYETWSTDNIYIYFDAPLLMNSLGNHHGKREEIIFIKIYL